MTEDVHMGDELCVKGQFAGDSHCTMHLLAASVTHMPVCVRAGTVWIQTHGRV